MKLEVCTVTSLSVTQFVVQPKSIQTYGREHHSLSYRLRGHNVLSAGDNSYTSGAGSLTFVPAGTKYTHHIHTESEQIVAHFTTAESIGEEILCFTLTAHCDMGALFGELHKRWERTQKANALPCMSAFYEILYRIQQELDNTAPETHMEALLRKTVAVMHEKFRDSGFTVGELHSAAYVSAAYFRRVFNKTYGCAPIDYLKRLRLNCARELLRSGYHTSDEIAALSGFSSPSYFCTEFKRMTGCTPVQFAKRDKQTRS